MMRRFALHLLVGVVLAAVLSSPLQAGTLFTYGSTVNVATAPTLPANPPGFGAAIIAIGAGNSLTFGTNSSAGNINGGLPGGADINFATIAFNASGSSTVVNYGVNFNYQVTITDQPSGDSGTVNFTGLLSGSASGDPRAINSTITNYAVSPQVLNLGGSIYQISAKSSTGPGSFFDGVLQANITIIPEPASLVLLGLGSVALLSLRRR